jgi:hypothetical protein
VPNLERPSGATAMRKINTPAADSDISDMLRRLLSARTTRDGKRILGHATTAFTMDVYTEVAEELADAAAEALSAYIPRAPRQPAGDSG